MPPRRSRPRATFMSDEGNKARVFESLTNVSNEARSAMDSNGQTMRFVDIMRNLELRYLELRFLELRG